MLPLTIIAWLLNEPILTVSSENTSRIGRPETSDTANKEPVRESVTENNWPSDPMISNKVELEPSITVEPVISKLPVIPNDPVISALPVKIPSHEVAFSAYEAVRAYEELIASSAQDEVPYKLPVIPLLALIIDAVIIELDILSAVKVFVDGFQAGVSVSVSVYKG